MHAFAGDSIMESLVASHWAGCVSTADRAGRVELDGVEIEDGKLYIARTPPAVPEAARANLCQRRQSP